MSETNSNNDPIVIVSAKRSAIAGFQGGFSTLSASALGGAAIRLLGAGDEEAAEVVEGVRDRDRQRFDRQLAGEDWRNLGQLLLSNAQDQAEESGVNVPEQVAEDAVEKSTHPARPA